MNIAYGLQSNNQKYKLLMKLSLPKKIHPQLGSPRGRKDNSRECIFRKLNIPTQTILYRKRSPSRDSHQKRQRNRSKSGIKMTMAINNTIKQQPVYSNIKELLHMVRNKSSEITHDTCNIDNRNSLGVASRSGSNLRLGNNGSNSTSKIKKSLHKNNNNGHQFQYPDKNLNTNINNSNNSNNCYNGDNGNHGSSGNGSQLKNRIMGIEQNTYKIVIKESMHQNRQASIGISRNMKANPQINGSSKQIHSSKNNTSIGVHGQQRVTPRIIYHYNNSTNSDTPLKHKQLTAKQPIKGNTKAVHQFKKYNSHQLTNNQISVDNNVNNHRSTDLNQDKQAVGLLEKNRARQIKDTFKVFQYRSSDLEKDRKEDLTQSFPSNKETGSLAKIKYRLNQISSQDADVITTHRNVDVWNNMEMMNRSANTSRVELNDTYKDLSAKMHMNSYNNRVCGDLQNRPSMGRDIYPNNSCSIEQLNRWHSIAYKNFNAGINTNADVRKSESATAHNTNIFDNSSYNTGANLGSMDQPGGNYNICISNVDVSNSVSRYLDYNMHSMGHNIKNNGNSNSSTAYNSAANSKLNFTKYSYTNLLNNANNNINSRTSISKCLQNNRVNGLANAYRQEHEYDKIDRIPTMITNNSVQICPSASDYNVSNHLTHTTINNFNQSLYADSPNSRLQPIRTNSTVSINLSPQTQMKSAQQFPSQFQNWKLSKNMSSTNYDLHSTHSNHFNDNPQLYCANRQGQSNNNFNMLNIHINGNAKMESIPVSPTSSTARYNNPNNQFRQLPRSQASSLNILSNNSGTRIGSVSNNYLQPKIQNLDEARQVNTVISGKQSSMDNDFIRHQFQFDNVEWINLGFQKQLSENNSVNILGHSTVIAHDAQEQGFWI